jgi:hypothetical protein
MENGRRPHQQQDVGFERRSLFEQIQQRSVVKILAAIATKRKTVSREDTFGRAGTEQTWL